MEKTQEVYHEDVLQQKGSRLSGMPTKRESLSIDAEVESTYTVRYILKHHKVLCWWCFFWAMTAIGWGFDAQVNGAMIGVPAFRQDFG